MKKGELRITVVTETNRRMGVNLVDLSPSALKMLAKIEPRILERDFYDQSIPERRVYVNPGAMLSASGDVHRPVEIAPGEVIPSEISPQDDRLSLAVYGHPRHEETFVRWLEGAVVRIQEGQRMRDHRIAAVHARMDETIDAWLTSLGRKALRQVEDVVALPEDGNGDWTVHWDRNPLARHPLAQDALRGRIDELAAEHGCNTIAEFLRRRERSGSLAARADDYVASHASITGRSTPETTAFYV